MKIHDVVGMIVKQVKYHDGRPIEKENQSTYEILDFEESSNRLISRELENNRVHTGGDFKRFKEVLDEGRFIIIRHSTNTIALKIIHRLNKLIDRYET